MITEDVQFMNGEIMTGEEIGKLIEFIVNKFAEEGLNCLTVKKLSLC